MIQDNPLIKPLSIGLRRDESAPKPLLIARHSGGGRNPVIKNTPRSGQSEPLAASFEERPNCNVVPLRGRLFNYLDTGLRRYDGVFGLMGYLG